MLTVLIIINMFLFGHTNILFNQMEPYLIYPIPDNNVLNARIIHYFLHYYIQNVSYSLILIDALLNLLLNVILYLYYYAVNTIEQCVYIWNDKDLTIYYRVYIYLYGIFIFFVYCNVQSICRW